MSQERRNRGPYKKYLLDEQEPVPKRSRIFYAPKVNDQLLSVEKSYASDDGSETHVQACSSNDQHQVPDSQRNNFDNTSHRVHLKPNQDSNQALSDEDNENASDDGDRNETYIRAVATGYPEQASHENFSITSRGSLKPTQCTIGEQSSSSSSHYHTIPPVRMTVNDPSLSNKATSTASHDNNGRNEEDQEYTTNPEQEVDVQGEQLLTVEIYINDGENETGESAEAEEEQEGFNEVEGGQKSLDVGEEEGSDDTEEEQGREVEQQGDLNSDSEDNTEQPNENLEILSGHEELWKAIKNNPTFTSPITTEVGCSPAEVLLKLLGLREQNNLSFKAFVDTAKLVNSIFVSPVVQGTQYLLDKLLLSSTGVSRYFYCKNCSFSFGKIDHKATPILICPKCETNNALHDLTKATYFVLFPIKCQIELLLMDKKVRDSLLDPKDAVKQNSEENILRDVYDGICYKEFVASLPENLVERVISCVFCTDGSPLFKSSTYSIWPFFLCINELPPLIRMRNLLLGGLWFGNKHPPMDLYLKPVVDNLSSLSRHGFEVKVDEEPVVWIQGREEQCKALIATLAIILVIGNASVPRSHNALIEHGRECLNNNNLIYVYGVQYVSPLVNLPKFDIVRGMVQDFPHNIPFGIARTFLDEWLNNSKRSFYIGSPDELSILNRRIECLKPCIEVRRGIRPLKDMANWKAREYENWILFYSLVVLINILPPSFWTHWSYLVQAVYLLSRESVSTDHVNSAHKLLQCWVADVERLYGQKYMSFNVHICSHLAENVCRWGPWWAVSTYCFESAIGELKNILHAQRGIPHQVERELSYCQAKKILLNTCQTPRAEKFLDDIKSKPNKMTAFLNLEECVVVGKGEDLIPNHEERFLMSQSTQDIDNENCVAYSKIIAFRCVFTTESVSVGKKFNNSVALTTSGTIVIIKKNIRDKTTEKVYIFCVEADCGVFLKFPLGVRILPQDHCVKVINSIGCRLKLLSVRDLKI
ncbi:Midasin, partial [Frankliniella fusca]